MYTYIPSLLGLPPTPRIPPIYRLHILNVYLHIVFEEKSVDLGILTIVALFYLFIYF